MSTPYDEKRREFLRSLLRWSVFGGTVAGVGVLASRHGETCVNQGICRGCNVFDGCGLPQALSAKEAQKESNRAG